MQYIVFIYKTWGKKLKPRKNAMSLRNSYVHEIYKAKNFVFP